MDASASNEISDSGLGNKVLHFSLSTVYLFAVFFGPTIFDK
jgi:hypothetical protein